MMVFIKEDIPSKLLLNVNPSGNREYLCRNQFKISKMAYFRLL